MSNQFDYQSVCHCSKTQRSEKADNRSLTTSQFVTAPKLDAPLVPLRAGLTTSQFVTAPKPLGQNPLCRRTDN